MKINASQFLLFIGLVFLSMKANSQTKVVLCHDSELKLNVNIISEDSATAVNYLEKWVFQLRKSGFIEANMDSIVRFDSLTFFIHIGMNYTLISKNQNQSTISGSILNLEKKQHRLLNLGYPFANPVIRIDSIKAKSIYGESQVINGPTIVFDSIQIIGSNKVGTKFLSNHLNIKKGYPFQSKSIELIKSRINSLSFIKLNGIPDLIFISDKAYVTIPVKDVQSNSFDGVIGVLPNEKKYNIVGDVSVSLLNIAKTGSSFNGKWAYLPGGAQDLKLQTELPYIFNINAIPEFNLSIFRRDSTFLETQIQSTLKVLQGNWVFGVNYKTIGYIVQQNSSSNYKPSDSKLGGLSIAYDTRDNFLEPKAGFLASATVYGGTRKVGRLTELDTAINGNQYLFQNAFWYGIRVNQNWSLILNSSIRVNSASKLNDNEAFRYGGNKDIKGYNEASLKATFGTWFAIEPRYYFSESEYFFTFLNHGFLNLQTVSQNQSFKPLSTGFGMNLKLNSNYLKIVFAIGRQQNSFDIQQARIHIGFVTML